MSYITNTLNSNIVSSSDVLKHNKVGFFKTQALKVLKIFKKKDIPLDDRGAIYDVSSERLIKAFDPEILTRPITVTMVGVEYAGLIKQGGLAEAIEGMSRGIKEQNPNNRVKLIFPKYSHLPKNVLDAMGEGSLCSSSTGEYFKVYVQEINGVICHFIEHPSFELAREKPDVYGPDYDSQANRFAAFSQLAADLIYVQGDTDVVHLHDWHVSGVAMKLKKEHSEEWNSGKIPAILFTYHNNNRAAQGRMNLGPYSYGPISKGFQDAGITKNHDNLFVRALLDSDAVTTVSESFGVESQTMRLGEGISFAIKGAAKVGKVTGIINGTDPKRWNPETDPVLLNWKDIETGNSVDLSYGPEHLDILGQKAKCKAQLQKWTAKFKPDARIDFSKPLVTYIGRFDSYQKGLDKFEEAIKATLANGGQFICMGMGEDPDATKLMDALETKYRRGVLFLRDFKDSKGWLFYQQGNAERPGIGPLVRAASEFVFLPSRFEPCGLVQFEAWLFGSLAIGSETGGLADTIIPLDRDPDHFNGFLFKRESERASRVIERALHFWRTQTDAQKVSTIQRIIREGRLYGWTTAPRGYSPAEKYRFAYENAKSRVACRQKPASDLEDLKHRRIDPAGRSVSLEERYLYNYYTKDHDSLELEKRYKKLSQSTQSHVPPPYGIKVNHTKYEQYGAFLSKEGGARFSLLAPHAKQVSLILENRDAYSMCERDGQWTINVPDIKPGQKYQYKIDGKIKMDPYGRAHHGAHSIVVDSVHAWNDANWMAERLKKAGKPQPMNIYELHPASWKKEKGEPLNYRQLGEELVKHCKQFHHTHVELMGILEHNSPLSWGYQVSGFFAPTTRMGSVDDFKYMVDYLHKHSIGVFIDWVPAHFSTDASALTEFKAVGDKYERSYRNRWLKFGSRHFDFAKKEVREFLISSAHYWLKEMHLDGLRVDCVTSLNSTEDKASAELFMRDLNAIVHNECPGTITMAEDYNGTHAISAPYYQGGFQFDMKWHVGWKGHTLYYFSMPFEERKRNYRELQKAVMCDNFHKQIMALSHDEVSTENKGPLLYKAPKQQDALANVRAIMSFMMCLPGKKLNFAGNEYANEHPWNNYIFADRGLLDDIDTDNRKAIALMNAELNRIYATTKAFYELDENGLNLEWIIDPHQNIHAYRRASSEGETFACFHNFGSKEAQNLTVTLESEDFERLFLTEIFNSDDKRFGGQSKQMELLIVRDEKRVSYTLQVPPLSTILIKEGKRLIIK